MHYRTYKFHNHQRFHERTETGDYPTIQSETPQNETAKNKKNINQFIFIKIFLYFVHDYLVIRRARGGRGLERRGLPAPLA